MADRDTVTQWLLEVTALPTASGREHAVLDWARRWAGERDIPVRADAYGNLMLGPHTDGAQSNRAGGEAAPFVIVAHTDHPAFVVESLDGDGTTATCSFRGGVKDAYFTDARLTVHAADGSLRRGTVTKYDKAQPWGTAQVRIEGGHAGVDAGDIARWELPDPEIDHTGSPEGLLKTHACDNLASVVAALAALDALRHTPHARRVSVLLTRAEEVGFVGAIGALREGTVPEGARVVVLENSRSYAESPAGGGAILRVGDRASVFSTRLTSAIGKVAIALEQASAGDSDAAAPNAGTGMDRGPDVAGLPTLSTAFSWQRKLMPGGACEATVFVQWGFETACICLPLLNYHNMAGLDELDAGTPGFVPALGRETIALSDAFAMIDLLVAMVPGADQVSDLRSKLEGYLDERAPLLGLTQRVRADASARA